MEILLSVVAVLLTASMISARPHPETTFESPFPADFAQFRQSVAGADQGLSEPAFAKQAFPEFPSIQFPFKGELQGNKHRRKRQAPVVLLPSGSHQSGYQQPAYGQYEAPSHNDEVAYGADTTGGHGAFKWYSDHLAGGGYHR